MFNKMFVNKAFVTVAFFLVGATSFASEGRVDPVAQDAVNALHEFYPQGFYDSRWWFNLLMNADVSYSPESATFTVSRATGVFAADQVTCTVHTIPAHSGGRQVVRLEKLEDEVRVEVLTDRRSCEIIVTKYRMTVRSDDREETLKLPRRVTDGFGRPVED